MVLSEYDIQEEVKRIKKSKSIREDSVTEILMKAKALEEAKEKGRRRGGKGANAAPRVEIEENPAELFIEHRVRELLKRSKKLLTGMWLW